MDEELFNDNAADLRKENAPYGFDDEVSVVEIASALLGQRRIFFRTFLIIAAITLVIAITRPTRYTSRVTFFPETSEPVGALAIAAQFGISIGSGSGERSLQFYADLVRSKEILRQIVATRYPARPLTGEPEEIDLSEYYKVKEETEEERIERAMGRLIDDLSVATDLETGIVSFSVTTSDPVLSYGIATRVLDLLRSFDLTIRQSQAGAERLFTGERLDQQLTELRQAEDSLQSFLIENRGFSNSPTLQFAHDRLERAVIMRQELATSLAQAFQQARIDEVRNTPVITLIGPPRVPALRDPKGRLLILAIGMLAGVAFGVLAAVFFRNFMVKPGVERPSDLQELASLWRDTRTDLRRFVPWPSRRSAG